MSKTYISFKEFTKSQLEAKKLEIINDLEKKDCQKVEFLRGMLCAYSELINDTKWDVKEKNSWL
jgi:hypothetical protein